MTSCSFWYCSNNGQNLAAWSAESVRPLAMMSARFDMRSVRKFAMVCSSVSGGALLVCETGWAVGAGSADQAGIVITSARAARNLVFIGYLQERPQSLLHGFTQKVT